MLKSKVKIYYNNPRPEGITKEIIQNIQFLTAPAKLRRATKNTVFATYLWAEMKYFDTHLIFRLFS